jgi:hypothetical protein
LNKDQKPSGAHRAPLGFFFLSVHQPDMLRLSIIQQMAFAVLVDKVNGKINANHNQIQTVHEQHVIDLRADDLACYSRKIADDDCQHKDHALAARGS